MLYRNAAKRSGSMVRPAPTGLATYHWSGLLHPLAVLPIFRFTRKLSSAEGRLPRVNGAR